MQHKNFSLRSVFIVSMHLFISYKNKCVSADKRMREKGLLLGTFAADRITATLHRGNESRFYCVVLLKLLFFWKFRVKSWKLALAVFWKLLPFCFILLVFFKLGICFCNRSSCFFGTIKFETFNEYILWVLLWVNE